MRKTFLLPLCLLSAAALGQTVPLHRTLKTGEVFRYRVTIVFTIYGSDVFYTSVDTQTIKSIDKDGSYTVSSVQSDIRSTEAGAPLTVMPQQEPSLTTYSARGQVIGIKGEQAPDAWRIADMSCFILPDKAVAKGDAWTYTIPARADLKTSGATYTYSYEGPEPDKVDGFSVLRIAEDYKETTQFNKATSTGTLFVDPSDGTIVKLDEEWHAAPILGVATQVNGHVSYERIS